MHSMSTWFINVDHTLCNTHSSERDIWHTHYPTHNLGMRLLLTRPLNQTVHVRALRAQSTENKKLEEPAPHDHQPVCVPRAVWGLVESSYQGSKTYLLDLRFPSPRGAIFVVVAPASHYFSIGRLDAPFVSAASSSRPYGHIASVDCIVFCVSIETTCAAKGFPAPPNVTKKNCVMPEKSF